MLINSPTSIFDSQNVFRGLYPRTSIKGRRGEWRGRVASVCHICWGMDAAGQGWAVLWAGPVREPDITTQQTAVYRLSCNHTWQLGGHGIYRSTSDMGQLHYTWKISIKVRYYFCSHWITITITCWTTVISYVKLSGVRWLHFEVLSPERQSARMSEIKYSGYTRMPNCNQCYLYVCINPLKVQWCQTVTFKIVQCLKG